MVVMEALTTPFLPSFSISQLHNPKPKKPVVTIIPSPINKWTLSDGNTHNSNRNRPKPYDVRNPNKKPLSDNDARRIIHARARYLSLLRRNQGPLADAPRWIRRTPEQMARFLEDDRGGHVHGKHVVAAIKTVRAIAARPEGSYDMREVMRGFVARLTFREMCVVLKAQRGWRQARDFLDWMKLQLCYRPSVVVYTIILRLYGQVGKIKLAEQTFLEMLEVGCEPDEIACGTMLCAYAKWGRHKQMLTFYEAVRMRDISLPISVFNFMISSLQKRNLHGKAIQLWKQMIDDGVEPNHFTYTIAVSSYVKEGFLDGAIEIFHNMRNSKIIPEEVTYSILISSYSKNGKWNEALQIYDDMKSQGIVPSNYTCASLLTIYYKTGDYSKALSLFSDMERNNIIIDEVIYSILVRIYGKLGLYEDAVKTFQDAEALGLIKDEKAYAAMVHVHLNAGKPEKALEIFDLMRSKNVKLTIFSHYTLLRCYVAKEDIDNAEMTFQTLSKKDKLDAISYNEMLALYAKMNHLEKAKALISQVRKDQVQFDENLFRTVVRVYCKAGMINEVEVLLQEMESAGMDVDKFTKTSLMVMYGDAGGIQKAESVFRTLENTDMTALSVMICLYLKNGEVVKSKEILRSLLEASSGLSVATQLIVKFVKAGDTVSAETLYKQIFELGYVPEDQAIAALISLYEQQQLQKAEGIFASVSTSSGNWSLSYRSMVDAYVKCGDLEKTSRLVGYMVKNGVAVNAFIVSVVVNALTRHGKFEDAESIIQATLNGDVKLDTVAYNTCIKAMLEAGKLQLASSIYDEMVASGITPSIQTYNTMISVFGKGGKLEKAVEIFNTAQGMGILLDEKAYTNMISYYGKAGKSKEASLLFREMQEKGIRPGKISYNVMFNAYATDGLYNEAENLLALMIQAGHTPDSVTYLALLRSYVKSNEYIKGEEVIHRMQERGIFPLCTHFNQLIFAHTKSGAIKDAERLCNEMQQLGLYPDLACCRSMLRAYMDHGLVDKGISFYEKYKTVKPDGFILSAAVHLYDHAGRISEAGEMIDFMNSHRIVFINSLKIGSRVKTTSNFP